jgi:SnoaL-like domain
VKDIVDDTCTWISPGPQDKLPWAGNFNGRQEIADFFARVAQNLDFTEFAPRKMIEQGDTVVVIGTSSARAKRTGKTIKDATGSTFSNTIKKGWSSFRNMPIQRRQFLECPDGARKRACRRSDRMNDQMSPSGLSGSAYRSGESLLSEEEQTSKAQPAFV